MAGSFVVAAVDGDVRVAQVAGELQLGSVDGDLNLADVVGNIRATVEGDASLIVNLAPGQQVIVAAGGDVNCQVPLDVNATVQVRAGGDIAVKRLGEIRKERNTSFAFQLGNGDGASLQLSADGDLLLRGVEMPKIDMNLSMDADIDA